MKRLSIGIILIVLSITMMFLSTYFGWHLDSDKDWQKFPVMIICIFSMMGFLIGGVFNIVEGIEEINKNK